MGYFKNELIAQQVELGDRIPAPKPATIHVAWDTRRSVKQRRATIAAAQKRAMRKAAFDTAMGMALAALAGLIVGVPLGMLL